MSDEILWRDPPIIKHVSRTSKSDLIKAMRKNPGRWLVWNKSSTRANASNIRHRYPGIEVEWAYVDRSNSDRVTIFARYPPIDTDQK